MATPPLIFTTGTGNKQVPSSLGICYIYTCLEHLLTRVPQIDACELCHTETYVDRTLRGHMHTRTPDKPLCFPYIFRGYGCKGTKFYNVVKWFCLNCRVDFPGNSDVTFLRMSLVHFIS